MASINVSSFQFLSGKYGDFSAEWYQDVGVSLMLTMIINILSPHLNTFVTYLRLEIKRFWDRGCTFDYSRTKQDTQRDLDTLYRGPKFDLAQRYAQILTTIFITYLLSAGMPLLHVIGFCGIFITYWADKFSTFAIVKRCDFSESIAIAFLRITRSPPLYDAKIARMTGSLLPYAVVLHCCVALWMFSNSLIFQTVSNRSSSIFAASRRSFVARWHSRRAEYTKDRIHWRRNSILSADWETKHISSSHSKASGGALWILCQRLCAHHHADTFRVRSSHVSEFVSNA